MTHLTRHKQNKPIAVKRFSLKRCHYPIALGLSCFMAMSLASTAHAQPPQTDLSVVEQQLSQVEKEQTQLIRHALQYDFFGQRCRGSSLKKYFNKTNRLFLSKYGFTANNYIRDFINPEVDEYKAQLQQEFLKSLIKNGDCRGARQLNWRKTMNDEFNRLYSDVEKSVWFPE